MTSNQNCCVKKIPDNIKNLLSSEQKVKFKGSYNITEDKLQNGNFLVGKANICKNKTGINICSTSFDYVNTINPIAPNFLQETYTIRSFNSDLTLCVGNIVFTSLYSDSGTGGISKPAVHSFLVLNGDGIYKCIKTVIIDMTFDIRVMYFCS